ncbi:hypothetical protein [Lacticaseibacillus mingshuiensis]|nr:hypothetical protein [Lacticaseibacillus mingshuiensis]
MDSFCDVFLFILEMQKAFQQVFSGRGGMPIKLEGFWVVLGSEDGICR